MRTKWLTLAVLAIGLCHAALATAQYLPTPLGAARMPDPTPCNTPAPNLVPGPITPLQAPPGPPDELSLPANGTSAFQCEDYAYHCETFLHVGAIGLRRQRPGNAPIVFTDITSRSRLDTGANIRPLNFVPVLDLGDISPTMSYGVSGTAGVLLGSCSLELSGFFIPEKSTAIDVAEPGKLNLFFTNPPLGFEGNNGLWRQADQVKVELESTLASAEVNIRLFNSGITGCEPLIGVRYMDFRERLSILTDDEGLAFRDAFGRNDPNRIAEYSARVINRIFAPQLGVEYQCEIYKGFAVGAYAKAAVGINLTDATFSLRRANGLEGLGSSDHAKSSISHFYDTGIYTDIYMLERLRVRLGYQAMFLCNVMEAADQVNYNLANPAGHLDYSGNVFFHGPQFQLQFLF